MELAIQIALVAIAHLVIAGAFYAVLRARDFEAADAFVTAILWPISMPFALGVFVMMMRRRARDPDRDPIPVARVIE